MTNSDENDYVEIELVRGSGRFVRVPRRRGPLERLMTLVAAWRRGR